MCEPLVRDSLIRAAADFPSCKCCGGNLFSTAFDEFDERTFFLLLRFVFKEEISVFVKVVVFSLNAMH